MCQAPARVRCIRPVYSSTDSGRQGRKRGVRGPCKPSWDGHLDAGLGRHGSSSPRCSAECAWGPASSPPELWVPLLRGHEHGTAEPGCRGADDAGRFGSRPRVSRASPSSSLALSEPPFPRQPTRVITTCLVGLWSSPEFRGSAGPTRAGGHWRPRRWPME